MFKFYQILFFNTLILGTLISISSYSWMSMWMGLEINLLSIIPLMSNSKNLFPSEAALKYFITQALASNILLFAIILLMHFNQYFPPFYNSTLLIIMNSALLMKLGAAPFHFWFPEIIDGLNWNLCLIMLTWQKIAPFILLMYNLNMTMFLLIIIITSSLIGGIQGLNQTSLRKIMTYSSINHMGWMIASMLNSQSIWLIYILIYTMITLNLIFIFKTFNIYYLKQLFNSMNQHKLIKFIFILNFLSLSGLPPFLGFYPKWLTLNNLILNNFYLLSTLLVIFTLISMYMYMRISFSTLMINLNETIIFNTQTPNFTIFMFNFLTLSGLILLTQIFNIL